jgi:hypothetical protein
MIFESLRQSKPAIRNTFGVNRYNTRLNFYLFATAKLQFIQQKSLMLNRMHVFFMESINFNKKNKLRNFEPLETTLFHYELTNRNN